MNLNGWGIKKNVQQAHTYFSFAAKVRPARGISSRLRA
jgi:TPR repeat protein